ncbi:hypothetical protein H696_00904 [Fonticula alba]|uniref:Uncharacterized protein n=1 Tax=Fonticula alba TaxID=691883 RepID=A0A058ZG44_FONAL|nr:hypothetical protein H696_00904 [Fonticula alba]KCV73365.1 hypothetical protein H696_00904 [Fonticula alba]|eukprot:XP_009493066.1 hypothetical protein H696_00904 [Fonticula alba]
MVKGTARRAAAIGQIQSLADVLPKCGGLGHVARLPPGGPLCCGPRRPGPEHGAVIRLSPGIQRQRPEAPAHRMHRVALTEVDVLALEVGPEGLIPAGKVRQVGVALVGVLARWPVGLFRTRGGQVLPHSDGQLGTLAQEPLHRAVPARGEGTNASTGRGSQGAAPLHHLRQVQTLDPVCQVRGRLEIRRRRRRATGVGLGPWRPVLTPQAGRAGPAVERRHHANVHPSRDGRGCGLRAAGVAWDENRQLELGPPARLARAHDTPDGRQAPGREQHDPRLERLHEKVCIRAAAVPPLRPGTRSRVESHAPDELPPRPPAPSGR